MSSKSKNLFSKELFLFFLRLTAVSVFSLPEALSARHAIFFGGERLRDEPKEKATVKGCFSYNRPDHFNRRDRLQPPRRSEAIEAIGSH